MEATFFKRGAVTCHLTMPPPKSLSIFLLLATAASAAVTRVELVDRADLLAGEPQGAAGAYERIVAKAYFAVDPKLAPNQIIADLALAPRNDQGLVEYSADVFILKPRDPAKGNGTALVEISNRGGKGLLSTFDFASGSRDPRSPPDFGDRFLLKQGFTLVWIGWEFDVPASPTALRLYAPIATDNGKPITGMVLSEWIGDKMVKAISLGDRDQVAYPLADGNAPGTQLSVRDHIKSERKIIPRSQWKFSDDTHVTFDQGFEPGRIYEVVYQAKDPVVVGLGPAAIRDFVSFLKYGGPETLLGDQSLTLKRALAFGVSQSGRFLREYLYDGFNQDEKSRKVFDGVWAHVAGAGRGSFNFRFAQPSRDGHPFLNVMYPTVRRGRVAGARDERQRRAQGVSYQRILRVLGPCGVPDPHFAGRQAGCAAQPQRANLLFRGIAAWDRKHPAAESGSAKFGRHHR